MNNFVHILVYSEYLLICREFQTPNFIELMQHIKKI
jgi:hypothetical protein